jgi:hypothetical protein
MINNQSQILKKRSFGRVAAIASVILLVFVAVVWLFVQKQSDIAKAVSWKTSALQAKPELILQARWGKGEDFPVGFYKATNQEGDISDKYFDKFFVVGNRTYILDPVKEQISVFEKNILVRSYPRPSAESDQDIAVSGSSIYVLNLSGALSKIDSQSGDYKSTRIVIDQNDSQFLTYNSHQIYLVQNTLLITSDWYKSSKCYSIDALDEVPCPFSNADKRNRGKLPLGNGYYAAITPSGSRLYDLNGKVVGSLDGINSYRVNLDGAYYREQSEEEVKLFFIKWRN